MLSRPLRDISFSDVEALLGSERESKTLEFKREMPARNNEEKIKFLRAVSSFANTSGGDLIIGVETTKGVATAIMGMDGSAVDNHKLHLSQILASQIEPRIPAIEFVSIDCGERGHVLLLRVQRSWMAPHRIRIDNTFYGRTSAGNYPLDVGELRSAFLLSDSASDRIRRFRTDRLIQIGAGQTPLTLATDSTLVIHVVPVSTFADGRLIDIVSAITTSHVFPLPPGRDQYGNTHIFNLDGVATYSALQSDPARSYAQVFRNGVIEGVQTLSRDNKTGAPFLRGPALAKTIVAAIANYLSFLKSMTITPPFFVFLSLCAARGCMLRYAAEFGSGYYVRGPVTQDTIVLPEALIDVDPSDIARAMRFTFDALWNTFGLERCNQYDSAGSWIVDDV